MLDLSILYSAIKDKLELDESFLQVMGGTTTKSRVVIGSALPNEMVCPALQIVGLTNAIVPPFDYSNLVVRTNAYALSDLAGTVPMAKLNEILHKVYEILDDQPLSIEGGYVYVFATEGCDADARRDLDYKNKPSRYFMGIEWRIVAR